MPTKNRIGKGKFFIWHTFDMQELWAYRSVHPRWEAMVNFINEPRYTVKNTSASYRAINHWSEQGLLEDNRDEIGVGWRKLTFKQVAWVRLLTELRFFGFPLEKLQETFKSIFFINGRRSDDLFDLAVSLCIDSKPVFLVVFQDGWAEFASLESLNATDKMVGYQHPYIRINLNTLLCEAFGTSKFMPGMENQAQIILDNVDDAIAGTILADMKFGKLPAKKTKNKERLAL